MIQTPSTKAILEVKEFGVDYLLQFIHQGRILFTVSERAGPGGAHDGFFIWEGTGLDEDDNESTEHLSRHCAKTVDVAWDSAVREAYRRALDVVLPS